jgi:hypothetical protein
MSESIRYTLKHPITTRFRGPDGEREETVSEVLLRRVKGRDMRALSGITDQLAQGLTLMGKVTSLEPHQVDELDVEDVAALGEIIDGFLPASLRTGPTFSGI